MSNPSIHFRGPFAYAWGAMATLLLAWLLWAPSHASWYLFADGLRVWFSAFMPIELLGLWRNTIHDARHEPELIRTLSQLVQRVGEIGKANSYERWWRGWPLLATGFCVLLSIAVGIAFWDVGPFLFLHLSVAGVLVPPFVFFWLHPHFLRRYRYG